MMSVYTNALCSVKMILALFIWRLKQFKQDCCILKQLSPFITHTHITCIYTWIHTSSVKYMRRIGILNLKWANRH